ncbi:MAG: isoprenylcysteine carboxylmethyltransferase family protein [Candidatus Hermodarchaeota archaeon]|nr:isoprenylcysteine carboxylmethyltransferase family protein [Candidatus Hermodarchaeota archaeon]
MPVAPSESLNKYGVSSIIREFVLVGFTALLLWVSAGFQLWLTAWIYIIFLLIFSTVFMATLVCKNPVLLNLRGAPRKAIRTTPLRRYDKIYFILFVPLFVLIPIVTGLEFQGLLMTWVIIPSPLSLWSILLGFVLILIGNAIFGWAMVSNPFFHGMMTIQEERGHQVISRGPYRWVRHPGYLGQILLYLGTPLLLGSWWAFLLGFIMSFAFIFRTAKEDQVLRNELEGYSEYAEQVRKRLLPGIW